MSSESSSCAQNKRARARDFSYGLWGGVEDMFLMCETMEYVQKIQVLKGAGGCCGWFARRASPLFL